LAERLEDLPELAAAFCTSAARKHSFGRLQLSEGAIRAAQALEWPGNMRQLENAIEAAVIFAAGDGVLEVQARHLVPTTSGPQSEATGVAEAQTFQEATRRFQMQLLQRTLKETQWNVLEASRRLDLGKSHVYNLVKVFGLARERG